MVDNEWHRIFRNRIRDFKAQSEVPLGAFPISIKIRPIGGCFHRECSPHAYELIDEQLSSIIEMDQFSFEEHESGPEILIYVTATTVVISLAKSIIDLIVTIIRARSEGIKKGDRPDSPLELIVRRSRKDGEFKEELILRIGHGDALDRKMIEAQTRKAIEKLVNDEIKTSTKKVPKRKPTRKKRKQ